MIDLPFTSPALVFFTLAILLLVAPLAAERVRLPGVIGLVLAGLAVGPEGIGLLSRAGTVEQLGGFGLLYLMFLAALELDLHELTVSRRPTVVFGLLTFSIPLTVGTSGALLLGFEPLTSVLIGSLWASHTLVTYPIIRRSGIVADPSVTATIGATVITDTLALIVLAVVAASFQTGGGLTFLGTLLPGLVILGGTVLWLLPRLAQWFFAGLGQDRTLRFLFVLVSFLGASVVAEAVGIEGIVGAFLAGLALNRLVPNGGALMQRIDFVGSSIFVPIFLISVGMLIDVSVVLDPGTLALAAVFTTIAAGSKWLAAEISGRLLGFTRPQIGVMFALSNSQAAATLAATIVGFELGLFDERVVNAVLIVILVTVIIASWAAARQAPRVTTPAPQLSRVGRLVLTPVARPETTPGIVRIGTWIARADGGRVVPFHVVTSPNPQSVLDAAPLLAHIGEAAARLGADIEPFVRVDRSVASGVVNTVIERDASLVLLGWKGEATARDRVLGSLLDDVADRIPCTTAVCWLPSSVYSRIVLVSTGESSIEQTTTAAFCKKLSKGGNLPVAVIGARPSVDIDPAWLWTDADLNPEALSSVLAPGDVLVMSAPGRRTMITPLALDLVDGFPDVSVIIVSPSMPGLDVGISEIFASN